MNLIVNKTSVLNGQVTPPGSKSHSIRAILLAVLGHGESILTNVLCSNDVQDAINVARALGVNILEVGNKLLLKSKGLPLVVKVPEINSGNSGITTHFLMPMLGLRKQAEQPIILNCQEQMRTRPIRSLVTALIDLGLTIKYLKCPHTLPIAISGSLQGGKTQVDGITSQYLSALLLALPCASHDSEIHVKDLQERPYMEMTLDYLKEQDIQFTHHYSNDTDIYHIPGRQHYKNIFKKIPADFSSTSYILAAAALIPGKVIVQGLDIHDYQGDKQLITILRRMGADITLQSKNLIIRGGKKLTGINVDARDCPDLLPTLAVIGTFASGKTNIYHVAHARIKETDRIHSMRDGLKRMGAKIDENEDSLTIHQSPLYGNHLCGYGDHRTVMALSIAGMIAEGSTMIDSAAAIHKTFPKFIELMQSLGAQMELEGEIVR